MSSITTKHPLYESCEDDWITMRDLYKGERAIKAKGERYLPPTASMVLDGYGAKQPSTNIGNTAYEAYKVRAVVPDYVKDAVEAAIGIMHRKPATFELPTLMKPLIESVTATGEGLQLLLRRINEEQLVSGRLGLLADMAANLSDEYKDALPYISLYQAESIINWDDAVSSESVRSLNLVVLNESGFERKDVFEWEQVEAYRVLQYGDVSINEQPLTSVYLSGVFTNDSGSLEYNLANMKPPMRMGAVLNEIPFAFINSKDVTSTTDEPPLLALGRIALTIYRGEADYRQNLYMQGQDTLVVIGSVSNPSGLPGQDEAIRTGAGSRIDVDTGGDAKYIGVQSEGLAEQRSALENDRKRAETKAGQLVDAQGNKQESGEALKVRIAALTATLNQIALAGAAGLESVLRSIARWVGADPLQVKVIPNTDFSDPDFPAEDLMKLITARTMGAPISIKTIHDLMVTKKLTTLTLEDELKLISEENEANPQLLLPSSSDQNSNPDE